LSEERTAAREASGVAVHPSGILLVVDDEAGIFTHARGKGPVELPIAEICGCEGGALDEAGKRVYVGSGGSRQVAAVPGGAKGRSIMLGEPEKRGALPELGSKSNKGWEGLAVRPGRFEKDKRPRLVAVHEGKPRQVGIFPLDDFDAGEILDLPGEVNGALDDLSDGAGPPKRGANFLPHGECMGPGGGGGGPQPEGGRPGDGARRAATDRRRAEAGGDLFRRRRESVDGERRGPHAAEAEGLRVGHVRGVAAIATMAGMLGSDAGLSTRSD